MTREDFERILDAMEADDRRNRAKAWRVIGCVLGAFWIAVAAWALDWGAWDWAAVSW